MYCTRTRRLHLQLCWILVIQNLRLCTNCVLAWDSLWTYTIGHMFKCNFLARVLYNESSRNRRIRTIEVREHSIDYYTLKRENVSVVFSLSIDVCCSKVSASRFATVLFQLFPLLTEDQYWIVFRSPRNNFNRSHGETPRSFINIATWNPCQVSDTTNSIITTHEIERVLSLMQQRRGHQAR